MAALSGWQSEITPVTQWDDQPESAFVPPTGDQSDLGYVGTQACRRCHPSQYESYTETAHWRSCQPTEPANEAENATFVHEASSSRYEIYRSSGSLYHRETLLGNQRQTLAVTQLPVKLTIGSGTHARTYLCESNGKFLESPISWYRSAGWDLSPGYDTAIHPSFSRLASDDCLFCHVGMVERSVANDRAVKIVEHSISCERCHGPGRSHAQIHDADESGRDEQAEQLIDSLVHPGELSRDRSEAICQQCHLQGAAYATAADKRLWDFVPGESLAVVRTDFQFSSNDEFKVAGHVEQLHKSACYQGSETLTCITCHDPHHEPPQGSRVDYFRQKCVQCHASDSCGVEHDQRQRTNHNDCSDCHMPRRKTDVTHAALHQHEIGVYASDSTSLSNTTSSVDSGPRKESDTKLAPLLAWDGLSKPEQERRLILAVHYAVTSGTPVDRLADQVPWSIREAYNRIQSGSSDPAIEAAFARNAMTLGEARTAVGLARRLVTETNPGSRENNEARDILGEYALQTQDNAAALEQYRTLSKVRHDANDWYLLGMCERNAGNEASAIEAFRRSLAIRPDLIPAHVALEEMLMVEHPELANLHRNVRQALQALRPPVNTR
ncbi:multiheme c-type cytochrome [Aporhodopirellula aestuarii]|uniref:Cytochrome c-552/4 domain-containing protein n=1 Tax=Aporhodopirellula aestuarii TaxID=2950107 RepID=A0ABT0U7J0_9BACT|nr:multiheme c-type cytochrome [Aporhodopirellula aestuarii]MCM2372870.1 hypothetical protein [Aporhodopirellula aestuarii]